MKFPAQTLTADRYAETFAEFLIRSREYPAMLARLSAAGNLYPDGFACLDIGAGGGGVLRDWLAREGSHPGRYVAVEPIASHAAALRETLAKLDLDAEVIEAPFDPQLPLPGEFDLVLFSHSLYWMPQPAACVRHAYNSLRSGGSVLAFLQGPFGGHPLYHLFNPLLDRDRPPGPNHGFSSHELVDALREEGLEPEVVLDPTSIDLTGMFEIGSEQARDEFLSFYLQIEFAQLGEPLKSDIVRYLQAACVPLDGGQHLHQPTAAVSLQKA